MRRFLLTTSALVALVTASSLANAADPEAQGYFDYPTTFISFEGGYFFNASPENASFGSGYSSDADKLGSLDSLKPGAGGAQGRFELGQRLDDTWDFKVGLGMITQREDTSDTNFSVKPIPSELLVVSGTASAAQKIDMQIADIEVGYRPDDLGSLQTRLFGGFRGLHAQTELTLEGTSNFSLGTFNGADKLGGGFDGQATDDVFVLGPRVGVDLALPVNGHDVALVGSASGSVLFGTVESSTGWAGGSESSSDSLTVWNVEGMAGMSVGIGERANLTFGYRVAEFGGLTVDRSDVDKMGDFSGDGQSDLLLHGPFARVTIEIP